MADEMVKETQVWLNKTYKGKTGFTTFTNEEHFGAKDTLQVLLMVFLATW